MVSYVKPPPPSLTEAQVQAIVAEQVRRWVPVIVEELVAALRDRDEED